MKTKLKLPDTVKLSPAEVRAWLAMLFIPDEQLITSPAKALSALLGVSRIRGWQLLAQLVKAGAVCKIGRQGAAPRAPSDDCKVHFHPVDNLCTNTTGLYLKCPPDDLLTHHPTAWFESVFLDDKIPLCFSCFNTPPIAGATLSSKKTPAGPSGIVAALKRIEAVYGKPEQARSNNRPGPDELYLAELYSNRRGRIDTMYEHLPGSMAKFAKLKNLLGLYSISRESWPAYMNFCFEEFPSITHGKMAYPPINNVAGEFLIDRFVISLGVRKLNTSKAERMLRAAGFSAAVHAPTVVAIASDLSRKRGTIADVHASPEMIAAIEWLTPRLREVGYADTSDGGGK